MTTDHLWHAVVARDGRADGLFVYGVRSTGVYCRPSCPSRRPAPERVEFFPLPAMARAHGYRACRRCHPGDLAAGPPAIDRVRRVCTAVARRPAAPWTATDLARAGQTSIVQLQRAFRRLLGLAPRDYVVACRRRQFLAELRKGRPVTEAIYTAGYGSPSRVYGALDLPGMTPATFGRGGAGATIEWATADSAVGRVLVAATDRGLAFVAAGPTDGALARAVADEFPKAEIRPAAAGGLDRYLAAAQAVAAAAPVPAALSLDI